MKRRFAFAVIVMITICAPILLLAQKPDAALKPAIIAGDLVQARTEVSSHANDLKRKFPGTPQPSQLTQGKALYDKALAAYQNWITTLHLAIADGSIKNLRNDADYKTKTTAAAKASDDFIKFAEAQTAASKSIFTFASDATTIGLKIWNAVKDRQKQDRMDFLVEFDKIVKWDDWDSIGAPPKPVSVNDPGKAAPAAPGVTDTKAEKKR